MGGTVRSCRRHEGTLRVMDAESGIGAPAAIEAVVFDLDGVITDTASVHAGREDRG
jgi:hypothetical protein